MFEVWVCIGTGTEPPDLYATLLAAWSVGQKVKSIIARSKRVPRIWVLKLLVGIATGQGTMMLRKSDSCGSTGDGAQDLNDVLYPHYSVLCFAKCLQEKEVASWSARH